MASKYWEHRAALRQAAYDRANNQTVATVTKAYDRAMNQLDIDIDKIMATYTRKTGLTARDAYAFLRDGVPPGVMDDLRARAAAITDKTQAKQLGVMLRTDAYRARISRLDAIKASTRVGLSEAAEAELRAITPHLRHTADLAYSRTMFDIQKVTAGFEMVGVPRKALDTILKSKWSGMNYAQSVWANRDAMAGVLDRALMEQASMGKLSQITFDNVRGIVDSKAWADKVAAGMKSKFKSEMQYSKYAANRLIRTESAYVAGQTTAVAYDECEIERYEFMATLDNRTSSKCAGKDGEIYVTKDKEVGVNWPPLHPHCRSTTAPVIDGLTREGLTRAARDKDGKSVYVPRDMKYQEWQAWQKDGAPDLEKWRAGRTAVAKPQSKTFVKASTADEAAQSLKRDFGINADFAKFGVDEANHVSKAVYESHSVVGDKGLSQLKGIAPAPKKTAVNSAAYYDPRDQTIYVKNYASGGVGRLTASAKKLADAGWFTTDSPMHIIRHEIGHSVHMVLSPDVYLAKYTGTNEFDIAVSKLKEDVKMLPTKVHRARRREESLSEYGMTNNAEYVAEAYAEYLNGNPRKPAADVMKLIFDRLGAI